MPDSEEITETQSTSKQPMGSSKRKRKQSIKRNIVLDDNAECDIKKVKVEKACPKKTRGEKKDKSNKNSDESSLKKKNKTVKEPSCARNEDAEVENDSVDLVDTGKEDRVIDDKNVKECVNPEESDITVFYNSLNNQEDNACSEEQELDDPDEVYMLKEEKQTKGKKKYECAVCAKEGSAVGFNTNEKFKQHMAMFHRDSKEEVKRFICTECPGDVWFTTKSKFLYHLGTKHPGIIKFICDICTETFKLKANYKSHLKTHNIVVQKKFCCEVCNGTFVNKAGFEAHKKRFPGPHIKQNCVHCGFSFSKEKLMKNHRCKTLLIKEAEDRAKSANQTPEVTTVEPKLSEEPVKPTTRNLELENVVKDVEVLLEKKITSEPPAEACLTQKQLGTDEDAETGKRVVVRRIIARRNQDPTVYRSVPVQNSQNVPESVVVQELREIDFENGAFIASTEPEQQFIVRDINGHLVQGNQILQLDINDVQPGEESQVYLADWNLVAPYVIREKYP